MCYHFLFPSPIRIVQSVLKLTLTEESIPAQCAHASYFYIYFSLSIARTVRFALSHLPSHVHSPCSFLARPPGLPHCAIPITTSNYGVSSVCHSRVFLYSSIQSTTLFFPNPPVFSRMVVVVGRSVNQSVVEDIEKTPHHQLSSLYFIDHNTITTTWDDLRLPSLLDANMPQLEYKRDFGRKLINFRSQPAMRAQLRICQINVRRGHIFEDSYAEIMRQMPNGLKNRLVIKFEREDGLDHDGYVARFVPEQAIVPDSPHTPSREFFFLHSRDFQPRLLSFRIFGT